jgi:aspartate/methionine/tyrosine aminotransferase
VRVLLETYLDKAPLKYTSKTVIQTLINDKALDIPVADLTYKWAAEWIAAITKVKSNMDSGMFLGIQQGAISAMALGKDWYDGLNGIYSERRKLVWNFAEKLGLEFERDTAGMFVWGKLPEGKKSDDLVDDLLYNKSIFVTPGYIFGSQGEGYVRFSLCVKGEQIKEAINRI